MAGGGCGAVPCFARTLNLMPAHGHADAPCPCRTVHSMLALDARPLPASNPCTVSGAGQCRKSKVKATALPQVSMRRLALCLAGGSHRTRPR